jgi:hypothetical protein
MRTLFDLIKLILNMAYSNVVECHGELHTADRISDHFKVSSVCDRPVWRVQSRICDGYELPEVVANEAKVTAILVLSGFDKICDPCPDVPVTKTIGLADWTYKMK